MKKLLKKILFSIIRRLKNWAEQDQRERQHQQFNLDSSVRLGQVELIGNIEIGKYTYMNSGSTVSSGPNSKVVIGEHCAIGRYVHITAKTHGITRPTSDENYPMHLEVEKDTIIGNYVWIGDKVFIKEGISVGNYAVIATNAVVTRDVEPFEIVGGIPIKHIRYNTQHYCYPKK